MDENKYSFLSSIKTIDTGRTREPKSKNPEGLTVRIMSNGSVYPSKELVEKFNLDFKAANDPASGFGFDIVDTQHWKLLADHPRIIMFGVTPKHDGKVDLFATTRYNEDGNPKANVLTQGAVNEILLSLVTELGWLTSEQKYVDLRVVIEHPFNVVDGIAYIPKVIEKGARKGERDYKRRDNVTFYPVEMVEVDPSAISKDKETVVTI